MECGKAGVPMEVCFDCKACYCTEGSCYQDHVERLEITGHCKSPAEAEMVDVNKETSEAMDVDTQASTGNPLERLATAAAAVSEETPATTSVCANSGCLHLDLPTNHTCYNQAHRKGAPSPCAWL